MSFIARSVALCISQLPCKRGHSSLEKAGTAHSSTGLHGLLPAQVSTTQPRLGLHSVSRGGYHCPLLAQKGTAHFSHRIAGPLLTSSSKKVGNVHFKASLIPIGSVALKIKNKRRKKLNHAPIQLNDKPGGIWASEIYQLRTNLKSNHYRIRSCDRFYFYLIHPEVK